MGWNMTTATVSQAAIDYAAAEPIATVGDFPGKLLEIGCQICGRHGYFTRDAVRLPGHLTFADASFLLVCGTCGARNLREPGWPLWVRPDARAPVLSKPGYVHPPEIDRPGRDWYEQERYLRLPINAWLAAVRCE